MVTRKPTLNNMSIQNYRKSPMYQAIVTDLCLEGIVPKDKAEEMLGYEIPSFMKGPAGQLVQTEELGKKPSRKKEAPPASKEE